MPGSKIHYLQAKYESYVALTASKNTAIRYAKALTAFFSRFEDKKTPDQFTRLEVEDFRVFRRREGISPTSINYEVQIVRGFFNWLIRMDEAEFNPCSKVKRLKEVEAVRSSLTEADQHRLYETAASTGKILDLLLVGLALSTGLRAETMYQLETSDVDFEGSSLRIPAAKLKARRNHEIPIRETELEIIKTLPEGRFFKDYARSSSTLSYRFTKLCKRSGIALRGLRTARRTFATTLLRTGSDLRLVQDLLCHRNIQTTSRYLTPADMPQTRAAIERLPTLKRNEKDTTNEGL